MLIKVDVPTIYDNIKQPLLPALTESLALAHRADFSVGYFNLRGYRHLAGCIENFAGGDDGCCRLLIGMQRAPEEDVQALFGVREEEPMDQGRALEAKRSIVEAFRQQLVVGLPTREDECALRALARHIREGKLRVRLFLKHPLHAKLYLVHRHDFHLKKVAYLGSSNLTFSGLRGQGELNIDALDQDATDKLARWFEDRWNERFTFELTEDLLHLLEQSWAGEQLVPPYHIYLKMAYHLAQEARLGVEEFVLPDHFPTPLFDYQAAAVKIAAHHLAKRGGVMIGDVVGLGKTVMTSALLRMVEKTYFDALILCPPNLVPMWEAYVHEYGLRAKVLPLSRAMRELPRERRYRLVVVDESHNLRNRDGKTYLAVKDYVERNDSHVVLLTATPYNKTYLDLSNQLRLFLNEDGDLGIRPEAYLRSLPNGERTFMQLHQCGVRSIQAFEKSGDADDWRDLMRLYLVRRTRSFIQQNYAQHDPETDRSFLAYPDGERYYFPKRLPKTMSFPVGGQYARLYEERVVSVLEHLCLPRYGLGNYVHEMKTRALTPAQIGVLRDLSRAGVRLMGFVRTNFFKRLESSGFAFVQSIERHIQRNAVLLYALEHDLDLPVGTQDAGLLSARDTDENLIIGQLEQDDPSFEDAEYDVRSAKAAYEAYAGPYSRRFKWLPAHLFKATLRADLLADNHALQAILDEVGAWRPGEDGKLGMLHDLIARVHAGDKVLVFSQFADTVRYLEAQLRARGVTNLGAVTGDTKDPTALARRFAPRGQKVDGELRVLLATDVLSEGQNLQDAHVVVNYDLPWAIIRLVQRAGRVDRIGQQAPTIHAYSFLPADGVEQLINLRARVATRLQAARDVVGSDEDFFGEGSEEAAALRDLYNEKSGILDDQDDGEVDLASYAYQIWKNAVERDPRLEELIPALQPVTFGTRGHRPTPDAPGGALVYLRSPQGNDTLMWLDEHGNSVTESQLTILKAAACAPGTPALPRLEQHHDLVRRAARQVVEEEGDGGVGALGGPSSLRRKLYERLSHIRDLNRGSPLFDRPELGRVLDDLLAAPLQEATSLTLRTQLKLNVSDATLAELVVNLRNEGRLTVALARGSRKDPSILCSMGLKA